MNKFPGNGTKLTGTGGACPVFVLGKEENLWAEKTKISERLDENIAHMEELFHTCDDIKKKRMNLGKNRDVACYLTFIEVSVDMGNSALLEVLKYLRGLEREEILRVLEQNALGTSDATYLRRSRRRGMVF